MKNATKTKSLLYSIFVTVTILTPVALFAQEIPGWNTSNPNWGTNMTNSNTVTVTNNNIQTGTTTSLFRQILDENKKYNFIVPLGPFSDAMSAATDLTEDNALVNYLRTWFKFLIGLAGIAGVVRLVMTGFSIITNPGSIDAKAKIRGELMSIITSLALVALSWVFLNTLNPALVKNTLLVKSTVSTTTLDNTEIDDGIATDDDLQVGVTKSGYYYMVVNPETKLRMKIFGSSDSYDTCIKMAELDNSKSSNSTGYMVETQKCYRHVGSGVKPEEIELRSSLATKNIYANADPCKKSGEKNCTNLYGLGSQVLDRITELASDCCGGQTKCTLTAAYQRNEELCPVLITGGTEQGIHKTHDNPYTLDIRFSGTVLKFLEQKSTIIAPSFGNNTRYKYKGLWYTDEIGGTARHFHVCAAGSSARTECLDVKTENNCTPTTIAFDDGTRQLKCQY